MDRDYPFADKTSRLSPYLSAGAGAIRQCFRAAIKANNDKTDAGNAGVTTWLSELIWREFYKHLVYGFPNLCYHKPFKPYTDKIPWNTSTTLFKKWQNGQTGFSIVDAAMHQLNTTGWMHNRLRMITASLLAKLMLIDWRMGEKYLAQR